MNQRGLAGTRNAGDARHQSDRDLDIDVLQIVLRRARQANRLGPGLPAFLRQRNPEFAAEILAGQRGRGASESVPGALKDDLAAVFAGARAQVENVVGGSDDFRIVFDDEHRVSDIAQAQQDFDQALRVARMQADRRLVEHVQRADQRRAQRRCQLDALRLSAGQRRGEPVQRQVLQSDVVQESQPRPDLPEDAFGDFLLGAVSVSRSEKNSALSRIVMRQTSAMFLPAM